MFVTAVLWTAFFIINFNIAMMIPLLPFIQRDIGLTPSQAGMVLAAFPVTAIVSNLALGPFIDRFGRRRFIVIGGLACGACFLVTAASRDAAAIALGRVATGLFMPMIGASVFAAIADYVPPARRVRVTGYVTSAAPIAFLLAMSLGVVLGGLFTWQVPVLAFAVVAFGLGLAAATLPPIPAEGLSKARITVQTYRDRLLSLSLDTGTRRLLQSYFCWAAAVFVFLGLYPSWAVQKGLAGYGPTAIGAMLFFGEIGGLIGALFSGRLAARFSHPLGLCAMASFAAGLMVLSIPFGAGFIIFQAAIYCAFAFGRDLMLALMLGGAMRLVPAAQRGSLNAMLNAIYQTGATLGGSASAWLYGMRGDFAANAVIACLLFAGSGLMLRSITRLSLAAPPVHPS